MPNMDLKVDQPGSLVKRGDGAPGKGGCVSGWKFLGVTS